MYLVLCLKSIFYRKKKKKRKGKKEKRKKKRAEKKKKERERERKRNIAEGIEPGNEDVEKANRLFV